MKKYHKRVEIKNDAECFTIAELKKGSRLRNFLLITVGTGIGGGIVIDGKDYRGMGYGAEFGHMYIQDEQWETLWKKTRARIKKEFGKELLIRDFVKMNDKKSKLILDECTDYFGKGILVEGFVIPENILLKRLRKRLRNIHLFLEKLLLNGLLLRIRGLLVRRY